MELDKFVEELKTTYEKNLQSVILYGSSVTGDAAQNRNDVMLLLQNISPEELTKGAKLIQQWMAAGNPEPLFINQDHINSSTNVFAIEFSDIKARHKVLWGNNPLKDIVIKKENLQLQCVREVKGLILALRESYVVLYPAKRRILQLTLDSSGSFFAILRAYLRLLGQEVPAKKKDMLIKFNELTDFDIGVFLRILEAQERVQKIEIDDALPVFSVYLSSLEKIAGLIDQV